MFRLAQLGEKLGLLGLGIGFCYLHIRGRGDDRPGDSDGDKEWATLIGKNHGRRTRAKASFCSHLLCSEVDHFLAPP